MSDLPELDRLLEEAELVRHNKRVDRQERFCRRTTGAMLLCLCALPVLMLFGGVGATLSIILMSLCVVPLAAAAVFDALHWFFVDPPPRDPTKRYQSK